MKKLLPPPTTRLTAENRSWLRLVDCYIQFALDEGNEYLAEELEIDYIELENILRKNPNSNESRIFLKKIFQKFERHDHNTGNTGRLKEFFYITFVCFPN